MELNTSDPEAAQKFYKAIFGWKYKKMKMEGGGVYVGIMVGEEGIGGIQKSPHPEAPPHWLGYVGVQSIKKTSAKVEKGGGKVLLPEMPIAGMGSLAIYSDPQGAMFAVWQPGMQAPPAAAEPAATQAAAPAKKKTAKKAAGKKAAKKEAATAEPAPAAKKKVTKKKASKKG
jgi:predicted enzyme related to lactoylglutathione lyase